MTGPRPNRPGFRLTAKEEAFQLERIREKIDEAGITRNQLTRMLVLSRVRGGEPALLHRARVADSAREQRLVRLAAREIATHVTLHSLLDVKDPAPDLGCFAREPRACRSKVEIVRLHFDLCMRLQAEHAPASQQSKWLKALPRPYPGGETQGGMFDVLLSRAGLKPKQVALFIAHENSRDRPAGKTVGETAWIAAYDVVRTALSEHRASPRPGATKKKARRVR